MGRTTTMFAAALLAGCATKTPGSTPATAAQPRTDASATQVPPIEPGKLVLQVEGWADFDPDERRVMISPSSITGSDYLVEPDANGRFVMDVRVPSVWTLMVMGGGVAAMEPVFVYDRGVAVRVTPQPFEQWGAHPTLAYHPEAAVSAAIADVFQRGKSEDLSCERDAFERERNAAVEPVVAHALTMAALEHCEGVVAPDVAMELLEGLPGGSPLPLAWRTALAKALLAVPRSEAQGAERAFDRILASLPREVAAAVLLSRIQVLYEAGLDKEAAVARARFGAEYHDTAMAKFKNGPQYQPRTNVRAPKVGTAVPAYAFASKDGGVVSSATASARPRLLYFWAAYCKPCRDKMPELTKLHASGQVEIVAVALERPSEELRAIIESQAFDVVHANADLAADFDVLRALGYPHKIPYAVLIDADGKVAATGTRLDAAAITAALDDAP